MFPDAVAVATLKEPVWRMRSAYNQFSANFRSECRAAKPQPWCPVYRYYQMQVPSFADVLQNELAYMRAQGALSHAPQSHSMTAACGWAVA